MTAKPLSAQPVDDVNRLRFLDGLRGLAAVYVMIGHARWLLWEGYSEGYLKRPENYGLFNKLLMYFFSLFKFGHEAVLFFFVLSGFVIHLKYAKNLTRPVPNKFNWLDYLYRRVKRIYPPFLFALLLTFVLDSIGKSLHWSIYYGTTPYQLINDNIGNKSLDIKTLLGNIFFLYPQYVSVYGTNGPSWSLKYEWWFYIWYPIFLLTGMHRIAYPTLMIALLFVASFFRQYWPETLLPDIFSMMITWWLGAILAEVYAKRIKMNPRYLSIGMLAIVMLPFYNFPDVVAALIMAAFFTGFISLLLSLPNNAWPLRLLRKLKLVGDFSYTLYIIHFPVLVFLSGWLMQKHGGILPAHFMYVFAGIIITLVLGYAVHFITEIPFTGAHKKKETTHLTIQVLKADNNS